MDMSKQFLLLMMRNPDSAIAVLSYRAPTDEIRRFLLSVAEFCDANPDIEELSINNAA
jgi:hypothetical protein